MGRHSLPSQRRKPRVAPLAAVAPAAVFFAVGADAHPGTGEPQARPVARDAAPPPEPAAPCCLEIVAAGTGFSPADAKAAGPAAAGQFVAASRYRVVDIPKVLPVGVAPERGLQVKTILVARSISAVFPEIQQIGGVRPDALRWHPNGLAIDVMIPNPGSTQGIALGNQIVAYVLKNAARFGIQDAIWRGTYYTPGGARAGGYGHYDHVHVTTFGGGYPTGGETYYR